MNFLYTLAILLAVGIVYAELDPMVEFKNFQQKYNKNYPTQEEANLRFEIFQSNLQWAAELNKTRTKEASAWFGVTPFMDISREEFRRTHLIANFTEYKERVFKNMAPLPRQQFEATVPSAFDWRNAGVVTGVYNQGQCGSCWAFSTAENIESMWARAGKGLINLSMQQIVDCDTNDDGCGGGLPARAYQYILSAGGLDSYSSYPYDGVQEACRFNPSAVAARISSWGYITQNDDESYAQQWTYANGPPSVCVDASTWQVYGGGVFGTACGTAIDHCVQATGWNVVSGVAAWTVRNSWGTGWGPYGGYLYVEMGCNCCAIGEYISSSVI